MTALSLLAELSDLIHRAFHERRGDLLPDMLEARNKLSDYLRSMN